MEKGFIREREHTFVVESGNVKSLLGSLMMNKNVKINSLYYIIERPSPKAELHFLESKEDYYQNNE